MSNDPGQSQDAGGYLLDAQDRHPSMQLRLARAQSTIRSLQIELNNARKTSGDVLETAKDWTNKLKRKYEGEAKELNLEINTLTNVIKETRHLPTIESKADSDSSDANVDRDKIVTRSRKRIKLETRPAMSTTDGNLTSGIPLPPEAGHFYPGKGPAAAPNSDGSAPTLHSTRSPKQYPACIYCYKYHLKCDAGEPCRPCAQKGRKCKRSKCPKFKTSTCRNRQCTRLHEEQAANYTNICNAGHVPQVKEETKRKKGATGGTGGTGGTCDKGGKGRGSGGVGRRGGRGTRVLA